MWAMLQNCIAFQIVSAAVTSFTPHATRAVATASGSVTPLGTKVAELTLIHTGNPPGLQNGMTLSENKACKRGESISPQCVPFTLLASGQA